MKLTDNHVLSDPSQLLRQKIKINKNTIGRAQSHSSQCDVAF